MARVTADGDLDPGFGHRGTWTSKLGCAGTAVGADNLSASCEGSRRFAGYLFVDRLNDDGSVDDSYGIGGSARLRLPHFEDYDGVWLYDAALGADGAVTLAGAIGYDPVIGRLTPSGAPDPGFPMRGLKAGGDINAITATADGGTLVVGTGFLAKLTPTGALDHAFAGSGVRHISFGGRDDDGTDVATDRTGRIVVAGSTRRPGGHGVLAVARLLG